jgi:hypothetical protein
MFLVGFNGYSLVLKPFKISFPEKYENNKPIISNNKI